jgi:predicted Zn-dependent protease
MVVAFAVTSATQTAAGGQAAGAQTTRQACGVSHAVPDAAEKALLGGRYSDAEHLYGEELKANPGSGKAMAGVVRAQLGEGKLAEALVQALGFAKAHPNDAAVADAVGEVRFRRGEVEEAATAFNQSAHLDPCMG